MTVDISVVLEINEADDNQGVCLACNATRGGVEPDATGYACEACEQRKVVGAAIALLYCV